MNSAKHRYFTRTKCMALAAVFTLFSLPPWTQADERLEGDEALQQLTHPVSTVEIGVGDITRGSFKAGDFTGLNERGAYANGNVDLRGGSAYDSDQSVRWCVCRRGRTM